MTANRDEILQQLRELQQSCGPHHPDVQRLEQELAALDDRYEVLWAGWDLGKGPSAGHLTATQPLAFKFAEHDGSPVVCTPYPGWRFVPEPDGGWRHEKIPSLWQRIKEFF